MKTVNRRNIEVNTTDKQKLAVILARHFKRPEFETEYLDQWMITDHSERHGLYNLHYTNDADQDKVGMIRGVVIDYEREIVIADSFGSTTVVVSDKIKEDKEHYVLTDNKGNVHKIATNKAVIRSCFEGALIRLAYYDGNVHYLLHRRLSIDDINYGNSPSFGDMYRTLGGPDPAELFDLTNTKYSPYVYFFMIVHPTLLVASKDNIGEGFIIYLDHKVMWDVKSDDAPFRVTDIAGNPLNNSKGLNIGFVESEPHEIKNCSKTLPKTIEKPLVYCPPALTVSDAENRLSNGFYNKLANPNADARLGIGEAVVMYCYDKDGRFSELIEIMSPSYHWRHSIVGSGQDMLQNFYNLTTDLRVKVDADRKINEKDRKLFSQRHPKFYKFNEQELKDAIDKSTLIIWPSNLSNNTSIETRDDMLYNVWVSMLMSVPPHRQKEVCGYIDDYRKSKDDIVNWLSRVVKENKAGTVGKRAKCIIDVAMESTNDKVNQNRPQKEPMTYDELIRSSIRNMINKEKGNSLYAMRNEMIRARSPDVESKN